MVEVTNITPAMTKVMKEVEEISDKDHMIETEEGIQEGLM